MQTGFLTGVLMPSALGVIMLGLGLSLTVADFHRVVVMPRPVLVGLGCQMLLLPFVCYAITVGFALPPTLAVGMMLLAASPGGPAANLYSHLARGDVALNITLTALNSVLSLLTLPLIVNFSLERFLGPGKAIGLQPDKVIQVFAVVLVPVALGMLTRSRAPRLAARLERPVKICSVVFLVSIVAAAGLRERATLTAYLGEIGLAALVFNLTSIAVGYTIPRLVRLPRRQAIAIGMEVGIHNGTLAIAIASGPTLLNDTTMAIPAAIYSLIMFITAGVFGYIVQRGADRG